MVGGALQKGAGTRGTQVAAWLRITKKLRLPEQRQMSPQRQGPPDTEPVRGDLSSSCETGSRSGQAPATRS